MGKTLRRLFVLGVLLFSAASLGTFFVWQHQPSRGVIASVQPRGTDVKSATDTLNDYSAGFFTTKIVSNLHLKNRNEVQTASILGQYLFTDKNPYNTDQLAITIGTSKSNAVSEVSPVQFRKSRPDEYREAPVDAGFPESSIVYVKEDGYEKAVFWTNNGRYAGVVISGGADKRAELDTALKVAVMNWQWK